VFILDSPIRVLNPCGQRCGLIENATATAAVPRTKARLQIKANVLNSGFCATELNLAARATSEIMSSTPKPKRRSSAMLATPAVFCRGASRQT